MTRDSHRPDGPPSWRGRHPVIVQEHLPYSRAVDPDRNAPDRRTVLRGLVAVSVGAGGLGLTGCSSPDQAHSGDPAAGGTAAGGTASGRGAGSGKLTASASTGSAAPSSSGGILAQPGPDLTSGPGAANTVALTFHGAGDEHLTEQALQITRSAGAHITVFAVGQWLTANPRLGRDIVSAGHDLGNHTWSHQSMTRLSRTDAEKEVRDGAHAVAAAVGASGLLFRPSGTPTSTPTIRAAALASGYQRCISYDVDPEDYLDPGADLVRSRTLAAVAAGSIVSLHLGHPGTIEALPGILAGLATRGLRAVALTELLAQT